MQKRPSQADQPPLRPAAPPRNTSNGTYRSYAASGQGQPRPAQRPGGVPPARQNSPAPGRYAPSAGTGRRPQSSPQPQPTRRPSAPPQRPLPPEKTPYLARRRPSRALPLALACASVLAAGCLMQHVLFPNGWLGGKTRAAEAVTEIVSTRDVVLSEVMTSNKTALSDETNAYPDWIELTNSGRKAADISGWTLTDRLSGSGAFTFPAGTQIAPGEYLIVFASGRLQNQAGESFHAPFKLSSAGDSLILCDETGTVVESINLPALGGDQSFARKDGSTWVVTGEYTPGMENTSLAYAMLTTLEPVENSPLVLSEVMASNASFVPASDGGYYDWIELYNSSSEAIDLTGYGLSDSADKPSRWRFPAVTIQPGEYLLVYASGLDSSADGELHASFRLRAEGESVLLYNAKGQLLDHVSFENLKADQSYARAGDAFQVSSSPTPGRVNQ